MPAERLRELISQDSALGDLILRAYLLRREMLIGLGAGFTIVGLAVLARHAAAARVLRPQPAAAPVDRRGGGPGGGGAAARVGRHPGGDAGRDLARPRGAAQPQQRGAGAADRPARELPRGRLRPASWWGPGRPGSRPPSTAPRRACETVALDAVATGGQAGTSSKIENYLGFPSGISGAELAERATIQAEKFGARISVPAEATALSEAGRALRREPRRRRAGRRADGRDRDRGPLPQARRAAHRGVRGRERLLRRDADGGAALHRRPGRGRGRRQLGRARRPCSWPATRIRCT